MKKTITVIITIIMLLTLIACDESTAKVYSPSSNTNKNDKKETTQEIIYHTVQFNTHGGNNIPSEKTDILEYIKTPYKENFEFDGWYLDETFTQGVVLPIEVKRNMTLHAKWLQIKSVTKCTGCEIKLDSDYSKNKIYNVTPSGFNLQRLQEKGYTKIDINVSYEVYYQKDYNAPFDIGYVGSPKYEIELSDSIGYGKFEEDRTTSKTPDKRTISTQMNISEIQSKSLNLKVSTNNIQNIIYFDNIVITYTCTK